MFNTTENPLNVDALVRSAKNAVLKEYLCMKRPKMIQNLLYNRFPVPKRGCDTKFIDVDAISTTTSNSIQEDVGTPNVFAMPTQNTFMAQERISQAQVAVEIDC